MSSTKSMPYNKLTETMSRQQRMYDALFAALKPDHLLVDNESNHHQVPLGSETHFKIIATSKQFINLTLLARHRLVYSILQNELSTGLHALSLHLYAPDEWQQQMPQSPACSNKR